jgi:hypothetical protein
VHHDRDPGFGSYSGAITVAGYGGARGIGAVASSGGASGNPTVTLSTTGANSLVAAGNEWDTAAGRTVPAGQQLLAQYLAVVGDTLWAQALVAPRALPGPVTLSTSGVTADSWNLAAVEILAAI